MPRRQSPEKRRATQRARYRAARRAGLSSADARRARSYSAPRSKKFIKLRKSGVVLSEARRISRADDRTVTRITKEMLHYARIIAKGNSVSLQTILHGMQNSDRITTQDWEQYIRARKGSGWVPLTRSKKHPGAYVVERHDSRRFKAWQRRVKKGYYDGEEDYESWGGEDLFDGI